MADFSVGSHASPRRLVGASGGRGGESYENTSTDDSSDEDVNPHGYSGIGGARDSSTVAEIRESVRASRTPGAFVVSSTGQLVNVTKFGNIDLNGSTGIVLGSRSEYLGPITIQQVVHGANVVPQMDVCLQGNVHEGDCLEFRDIRTVGTSGCVQKRSGLVLSSKSSGNSLGDVAVTTGSGLLWKHLLGRQPRTSTWIPVAWFSFMLFMGIAINNFVLRFFHDPGPSLLRNTVDIKSYGERLNVLSKPKREKEPAPNLIRSVVIPRSMWFAHPPKELTPLSHPVEYVIISHTATEPCTNQAECSMQVRFVQKFHIESRNWSDVGYNFMVGGDGNAYEGRGWEYVGAHAKGYNVVSIGISFIGTFSDVLPPPAQIRACKTLIKEGVKLGKVSPDYKLLGHRQVSPTESPGEKLYEELQHWEHWSPEV